MRTGLVAVGVTALGLFLWRSEWSRFLLAGALVDTGSVMQEPIDRYDFRHGDDITPEQVWQQFLKQNRLASHVREFSPHWKRHPVIALVACMDSRIDTNELVGDTRHFYYIVRAAGSVLGDKEEEMLELAVVNGVKVVVFTTHSDCAAEKVAADPERAKLFPHLSHAVYERDDRFRHFLERPTIRERISKNELLVKWVDLDTTTERLHPHRESDDFVTQIEKSQVPQVAATSMNQGPLQSSEQHPHQ